MLIERIRIQQRINQTIRCTKKVNSPQFESVHKALSQLQAGLESLQKFNERHPLLGRVLRWIDRIFCLKPLNREIKRIRKIAQQIVRVREVIIPRVIQHKPPLQPVKPPVEKEPFGIDPLKVQGYSDEALIQTLPDLFKRQLFREATLTQRILECMERNLEPQADRDLQTKLIDQLGGLIHQLVEQKDASLTSLIEEICSLYKSFCIQSRLKFVPEVFYDKNQINRDFQDILLQFKEQQQEYIEKDPLLKRDLDIPLTDITLVCIEFFLDINHSLQGKQKELIDQIGLGPLIYIKSPLRKFWRLAHELQRPDLSIHETDDLIFKKLGMINAYGLFKADGILEKVIGYFERNFRKSPDIEELWLHRNAVLSMKRALKEIDHPGFSAFDRILPPEQSLKVLFQYFGNENLPEKDSFFIKYLKALPAEDHEPFVEAIEYLYEVKEIEIPIHKLLAQIKGCEGEFLRTVDHMRQVLPADGALNYQHAHELIREYAFETACPFGPWAISGDVEERRFTLHQIAESFSQRHFEIAFALPSDNELSGSIEFLIKLHRFLELKDEPMLQEQLDELIFDALLPILSHHIYTMEGVADLLLDYFIRQLPLINFFSSLDFHNQCLYELVGGIETQPLKDTLYNLAARYGLKRQLVKFLNPSRYYPGLDLFISEFSYLNVESQRKVLFEIQNLNMNQMETLKTNAPHLHKTRMKAYASAVEDHLLKDSMG